MTVTSKNLLESVYGRRSRAALLATLCFGIVAIAASAASPIAHAQADDATILDARDALRKKDRDRLAALRAVAVNTRNPLAMWVDYWDFTNRIGDVQQAEMDAFSTRWRGSYVEDRLRNDWLLELGKRRDWVNLAAEFPRFRMNDDREVTCYALLTEHLAGKDVHDAALEAWLDQRDSDDGCALLAATLTEAKTFKSADLWRKARYAIDASRPRAARQAAALVSVDATAAVSQILDNPARYLVRSASAANRNAAELTTLALMRMATKDADTAARQMGDRWDRELPADLAAWVWATLGKQFAIQLHPQAADYYLRAAQTSTKSRREPDWPDDTLAWKARAALRADQGRPRWQQIVQAITAMSPAEQQDATWVYWKARALLELAGDSQDAESMRTLAREQLAGIAGQLSFYGALAAEKLGRPVFMPTPPSPLTAVERAGAATHPGLTRALQLIAIGLRSEGVREWNFSLRGMGDRELLAAAQLACDHQVWDRCINTSDRTRDEIDLQQRYPMPFREEVTASAIAIGLDPAYVYGLIRQESRFIMDARSSAGASGLMQLMPATARWTAKKVGMTYTRDMISDRDVNLRLGTTYLKLVLDEFDGSQALAAAAYNAGPGRPRRWRDGPVLETAAWAENVPFGETRDYVKKVLSNATYYAALLNGQPPSLKARLGTSVAPALASAVPNKDIP